MAAQRIPDRTTRLTRKVVTAIRFRMEASMGALSVRAAALADRTNFITDSVLATWLKRGEELRMQGFCSADEQLAEYEQMCLTLVELDGVVASRTLLLAGEAMEDILVSRDAKTAPCRVALIKHVQQSLGGDKFVTRQIVEHRGGELDFSQQQMDMLSRAQLERYEEILKLRAALAVELREMISSTSRREDDAGSVSGADPSQLH